MILKSLVMILLGLVRCRIFWFGKIERAKYFSPEKFIYRATMTLHVWRATVTLQKNFNILKRLLELVLSQMERNMILKSLMMILLGLVEMMIIKKRKFQPRA